jgi:hypothetical protein
MPRWQQAAALGVLGAVLVAAGGGVAISPVITRATLGAASVIGRSVGGTGLAGAGAYALAEGRARNVRTVTRPSPTPPDDRGLDDNDRFFWDEIGTTPEGRAAIFRGSAWWLSSPAGLRWLATADGQRALREGLRPPRGARPAVSRPVPREGATLQ